MGDDHGDEQAAVGRQRRFFGRQGKVDHRICVIGISDKNLNTFILTSYFHSMGQNLVKVTVTRSR